MAIQNYTCPGCGKLRKAPSSQDIARCRICGTTVEKIEGIWLETNTDSNSKNKTFNLVGFLTGFIFILLGFFLIEPISKTSWGQSILNQSFLFWGIVSMLIVSTFTLVIGFFVQRKNAYQVLRYSLLFIFAALIRLSFFENSLPLMQSKIYNSPQTKIDISSDSLMTQQILYTDQELEDLTKLFFELMTDKYLVDDIDKSSNLNVKKTLDTSENNYDYEIIPSESNDRFPASFRISVRDLVETSLQNQYYQERAGGLGLKISEKNDAIAIKDELIQRFENNYEIFESTPQTDNNHWISIKGENYFWVRFLTLDQDFMILEIIRYMNDADARQHKNVMDQVNSSMADENSNPKPLSPQEALACKTNATKLDKKKNQLDELELRLAYLDFGDPRSEEHIEKERSFNKQTQEYNLDLKLYQTGCENNISLDFSTYEQVCDSIDLKGSSKSVPFKNKGNRFCSKFSNFALRIQS
ncbi:MAG: hypothetical protein ABJR05_17335 [Balneola sp.]